MKLHVCSLNWPQTLIELQTTKFDLSSVVLPFNERGAVRTEIGEVGSVALDSKLGQTGPNWARPISEQNDPICPVRNLCDPKPASGLALPAFLLPASCSYRRSSETVQVGKIRSQKDNKNHLKWVKKAGSSHLYCINPAETPGAFIHLGDL